MDQGFVGQRGDEYTGEVNGTVHNDKILNGGLATLFHEWHHPSIPL